MMDLIDACWNEITRTEITLPNASFRLALSLLLGGIVGFERKRRGQIAGSRTFALISMGATLAMIVSIYIPQAYFDLKNGDPGRIAAQVITGVGFLGAGAIIQTKGSIRGLTTAAGIWMVAALGLAVGVGLYGVSLVATLLIFFILVSLDRYEHRFTVERDGKILRIRFPQVVEDFEPYKVVLKRYHVTLYHILLDYDYQAGTTVANFIILSRINTDYPSLFRELRALNPVEGISLQNEIK